MSQSIIDGTKVTIGADENLLYFRTFSREHKRSYHLFVFRESLSRWLESDKTELYDGDMGNFLCLQKRGDNLRLSFTWLHGSDERLYGHKESIILPVSLVENQLACESGEIQYLHVNRTRPSRFDFSNASHALKESIADKLAKRALSKALRDSSWRDTTVTMYNDCCRKSFFFREDGSWKMEGGLILHQGETHNRGRGKFPKVYYSVHT